MGKTIKVIDLLNKIAKGEEVPKKIRFDDTYWNRICGEKYTHYIDEDNDNNLFIYFFRKNLTFNLNDEVEIIEEDKKIEKLERINGSYLVDLRSDNSIEEQSEAITNLIIHLNNNVDKINELVKAVNELKKGK